MINTVGVKADRCRMYWYTQLHSPHLAQRWRKLYFPIAAWSRKSQRRFPLKQRQCYLHCLSSEFPIMRSSFRLKFRAPEAPFWQRPGMIHWITASPENYWSALFLASVAHVMSWIALMPLLFVRSLIIDAIYHWNLLFLLPPTDFLFHDLCTKRNTGHWI